MSDPLLILQGDATERLRELPTESVQCCVTSPPYWGLRDYGTATWEGGEVGCDHKYSVSSPYNENFNERWGNAIGAKKQESERHEVTYKSDCGKCGAKRIDSQLGLEKTPEEYVAKMVEIFRDVRRVLRKDGTLWLNLGDSYAREGGKTQGCKRHWDGRERDCGSDPVHARRLASEIGMKPKDLCGIPWRVAFALQQPYYVGRIKAERDRVWLAAILDGEGTICGMRHVRPDGNVRTGCMTFITNTSEALLDECDRIWKGSRYSEKVTSEVSRPCWRWELQSAEDRSALVQELYPYLIEKKRQALVAWNLLEVVQSAKRLGRGGENVETKAKRDLLVSLLSNLNQRRPCDIPSWLKEPPLLYEQGWWLRSDVIWSKSNPMPESVTDRPTKAHEYLFLLTKSAKYYYDSEAIKERSTENDWQSRLERSSIKSFPTDKVNGIRVRSPAGWKTGNGAHGSIHADGREKEVTYNEIDSSTRNKRSVWTVATAPYPEAHFATYPPDLIKPCIMAGSAVGDTVLDPFAGSGTTGMVAIEIGRKAVLIELNPEYVELIRQRCDVTLGLALAV